MRSRRVVAFGTPDVCGIWMLVADAMPPAVLAEAEQALADAGLTGHEEEFFHLLRTWCPD